ncbi:MAG: hypothetical protein PHI73_00045 [Patescibacteria group bacterium]|nr:hypothetical protein [Patescibacteria group bacterium]
MKKLLRTVVAAILAWPAWLLLVILLSNTVGCGEKEVLRPCSDTDVTVKKIGNVELQFNFGTIAGKTITFINGNDRAIGLYVVDHVEPSIVVLSDSYTGSRGMDIKPATFRYGQELDITVVIYKTIGGTVVSLIEALGADFLDKLSDAWVEQRFTATIELQPPEN